MSPQHPAIGEKYLQIASLIDPGAHVLDVGCGGGHLGLAMREKECCVDGLDLNLDRLGAYKDFYRNLRAADVEQMDFKEDYGKYDVVVFSDVLEHLKKPEPVLENAKLLLREKGRVIVSLPNVAYFSNRWSLFRGNWDYQDEGVLDRTHLRFYTLSTAGKFIEKAGYAIAGRSDEIPVIDAKWKRDVFLYLSKRWSSAFAIGWVFDTVPRSEIAQNSTKPE